MREFPGLATETLLEYVQQRPARQQPALALMAVAKIRKGWESLRDVAPGSLRAKAAHALVDQSIRETPTIVSQASCRSGCAHCCGLMVDITPDEASLLVERIRGGVDIDRERLALQRKNASREGWRTLSWAQRRCVFLGDDNRCRIYEDRPIRCRNYFVSSPPDFCRDLQGRSARLVHLDVECAASSGMNLGEPQPLPIMLSEALEET